MPPIILGPTGDFPLGKLNKEDEGGLMIGIGEEDGKVIISFGTPVAWVGMTPLHAMQFAAAIIARAKELDPTQN